jgi:lytic murein transglycosylase
LTLRSIATGAALTLLVASAVAWPVLAATCRNSGKFEQWLAEFKQEARAKGVSERAIAAASPHLTYSQRIVNIDRGQHFFQQTFLEFSDKLLRNRLQSAAAHIRKHRAVFDREEQEFGVPAAVITSFWSLESDFGANMGKYPALPSLTTLAYDCRRPELFRKYLFGALQLIDRGDLRPEEMIGSWAGEIGQTQFMPSEYFAYAVDYDGDGKRNLLRSPADVIGSTGKYLVHLGWRRGEPWLQEVTVPDNLPWQEADLAIQHPRSEWVAMGVKAAHGEALPADSLPAALVLPMGRFGPAFLAYPNFKAYIGWNESLVYALTAAYFATRLDGAPPMNRGRHGIPKLSTQQVVELQKLLSQQGYKIGAIDGKVGSSMRAAVRAAQIKVGLPPDSYPTAELIERLQQR